MNNPPKFERQSLSELIAHIEQTHHVFTRESLARIKALLSSHVACDAAIRSCFDALEADLLPHLMKEERILFPYIVALENSAGQAPESCFGSVANPIRMMGMEHHAVKNLLAQLRELTGGYLPPPESSDVVAALYAALAALDRDLVEHIHVENDVLFPLALEREGKA